MRTFVKTSTIKARMNAHPKGCRGDMMNTAIRGDDLPNRV